jgi:hypothetical protein
MHGVCKTVDMDEPSETPTEDPGAEWFLGESTDDLQRSRLLASLRLPGTERRGGPVRDEASPANSSPAVYAAT